MKPNSLDFFKNGFTSLLLFLTATEARSQYYFYNDKYYDNPIIIEVGAGMGFINCLTDLGGNKGIGKRFVKDINWRNSQPCISMHAGIVAGDILGLRLEGTFGKITAHDSILKKYKADNNTKGRYFRNLNFRSRISELAIVAEFHPLMLFEFQENGPPLFSPYLIAGLGVFRFNPQASYHGHWVDLRPLHLEGQGFAEYRDRTNYRLHAASFPVGIGLRYEINAILVARFEINHRFTSTDYLDDVSKAEYVDPSLFARYLSAPDALLATRLYNRSAELDPNYVPGINETRGKSKNNDSYFAFNLKVGFTLGRRVRRGN